jgi:hypothetical protein
MQAITKLLNIKIMKYRTAMSYTKEDLELLEEAKRRFPIGTIFCPAHIANHKSSDPYDKKYHSMVEGYEKCGADSIYALRSDRGRSPLLYDVSTKQWALVIELPEHIVVNEYNLY